MIKRAISGAVNKVASSKQELKHVAQYASAANTKPFSQAKQESAKGKELREQGEALDKEYNDLLTGSFVRRVLYDKTKPGEIKDTMYTDPKQFVSHLNDFSKKGPSELIFSRVQKKPVTVTVTGAAGNIAYSLLPRIACGEMLGEDQPINLRLLEIPAAAKALEGAVMELQDCAFPLVNSIVATTDANEAFRGSDYAILVGAKPRAKGMERGDLLKENAKLFAEQGQAINKNANSGVLVLVVGNPANTNALIASANAPDVPKYQFSALTRLDHDRGLALIAKKAGCKIEDISRFAVWGNHSSTMYPDLSHTLIGGTWFRHLVKDENWIRNDFIPQVQQRGAAIINARGKSSAASAADASIKHMRDWVLGNNEWLSMAIYSDGQYGVPIGIFSSFPVMCSGAGQFGVIDKIPIDEFSAEKINASCKELLQEKEAISSLLPNPAVRFYQIDRTKVFRKEWAIRDV